jgi:hypothetical protein
MLLLYTKLAKALSILSKFCFLSEENLQNLTLQTVDISRYLLGWKTFRVSFFIARIEDLGGAVFHLFYFSFRGFESVVTPPYFIHHPLLPRGWQNFDKLEESKA